MEYREELPENCPPDHANEIVEPMVVYRIKRRDRPFSEFFDSEYKIDPSRNFAKQGCTARALSVFHSADSC